MAVIRTRSTSGLLAGRDGSGFPSPRPGSGTQVLLARTAPGQRVGRRRLLLPGVPGSPSPPSPRRVRQGGAGTALLQPAPWGSSHGHSSRTTTSSGMTKRAMCSPRRRPSAGGFAPPWRWTLASGRSSGRGLQRDPRVRAGTGIGTRLAPLIDELRCWAARYPSLAVWPTGAAQGATGMGTGTETGTGSGSARGIETESVTGNVTGSERGSETGIGTCGGGAGMAAGAAAQRDGIWVRSVAGTAPVAAGCRGPGLGLGRPGRGRGGRGAPGRCCRLPTCSRRHCGPWTRWGRTLCLCRGGRRRQARGAGRGRAAGRRRGSGRACSRGLGWGPGLGPLELGSSSRQDAFPCSSAFQVGQ